MEYTHSPQTTFRKPGYCCTQRVLAQPTGYTLKLLPQSPLGATRLFRTFKNIREFTCLGVNLRIKPQKWVPDYQLQSNKLTYATAKIFPVFRTHENSVLRLNTQWYTSLCSTPKHLMYTLTVQTSIGTQASTTSASTLYQKHSAARLLPTN